MKQAGYIAKFISKNNNIINNSNIDYIYSVSNCISKDFCDYVNYWKHNKYWFFDSIEIINEIAEKEGIEINDLIYLFYEIYEKEFDENSKQWNEFKPEESLEYNIILPQNKIELGYDVVSYSCGNMPECSPLSCNLFANEINNINKYCLFNTFDEALKVVEVMDIRKGEPEPYRIIKINKVID